MRSVILPLLLIAPLAITPAAAQKTKYSSEDIVHALSPTQGGGAAEPTFRTRGLRPAGEEPKAAAAAPSVDLEVRFKFASAELTDEARHVLDQLGAALTDPRLSTYKFKLVGHTDAVGSETYNLSLSTERAAAVRDYLKDRFHVSDSRLESIGVGEAQLRDPSRPTSEVNRRVQVMNVGAAQ
jgi:outer membrane protein OmpA-like peptidoglycan-associated protein